MRAIIYARCSTDESKQDVEVQLKQLRAYCERQGWAFDERSEYHTAYRKGVPPVLNGILDLIVKGVYDVIVVYSMDRFSRLHPSKTEQMLNQIIDCKCRFISMQESLDSDNVMVWHCFKGLWIYFANQYSANLSQKTKLGLQRAKEKGVLLGRRLGSKDKRKRSKKGYYNRIRKNALKVS